MEQTPFEEQLRICKQFDSFCKTVLKNEANDYQREKKRLQKHEVCFSELNQEQLNELNVAEEWIQNEWMESVSAEMFHIFEYDIEVRDEVLYEALSSLSETKRKVILLSFFMELKDTEIAKQLNLVPSTIFHHKTSSLQKLKKFIEELENEKNE